MPERSPPATVVGLDTTGSLGSVAALGPSGLVARSFAPGNRHAANLLPALEDALAEAGVALDGHVLLAAARGPGSFTGLRVGLAAVQGLALATGAPAAGVSSLDAAALADAAGAAAPGPRLVLVDALRGELFGAVYPGSGAGPPVAGPFRIRPEAAADLVREHRAVRICGPGVARYRRELAACCPETERIETVRPLAEAVARLARDDFCRARDDFRHGGGGALEPLYLREPDATPQPPASFAKQGRQAGTAVGFPLSPAAASARKPRREAPMEAASASQETQNGGEAGPDVRLLEELKQQHRRLDEEIAAMGERPALTPEEQLRTATLKKRKLALRDQIQTVSARL